MHVWNTKALAKEFADRSLDQKEILQYLLVAFVAIGLVNLDHWALKMPAEKQTPVGVITAMLAYSSGVYWCYCANKHSNGVDFLERLLAFAVANILRVWLFVKFFIYGSIFLVGVPVYYYFHSIPQPPEGFWMDFSNQMFEVPGYLFWFWLIRRNILLIPKVNEQNREGLSAASNEAAKRSYSAMISFGCILFAAANLLMDFGCLSLYLSVQKCSASNLMPSSLVLSVVIGFIGLRGLNHLFATDVARR